MMISARVHHFLCPVNIISGVIDTEQIMLIDSFNENDVCNTPGHTTTMTPTYAPSLTRLTPPLLLLLLCGTTPPFNNEDNTHNNNDDDFHSTKVQL